MRKELNITEGIFPMPVLMVATYNEDGSVHVMNAAWGTMQARRYRSTEPHGNPHNRKKHQGPRRVYRQPRRCFPCCGSRLFRRGIR